MGALFLVFVLALIVGAVLLLTSLGNGLRPVDRDEVETLAERADLEVTTANIGLLVDSVARTRLWRTVGVMVALSAALLALVVGAVVDQRLDIPLALLLWGLVGYWAGCIVGELRTASANAGDAPRTASLVRRDARDYVGGWALSRPWQLAAVGGASTLLAVLLGSKDLWVILSGAATVVVAVVLAAVMRYVVERGRSGLDPDVAAADDAVRSRSLHAIAGASVGIGIWTASLAAAGLVLALLARLGVAAVESGATGTAVPVTAAGFLVLLMLCVIVPIVGFVRGRRLMHEPFAVARRAEASA